MMGATGPLGIGIAVFTIQASYMRPLSHAHLFQEAAAHARRAEDRGFDTFWLGEHHHSYDGYDPSVLHAATFLAASTDRLMLSTGIIILPLHAPERIAECCAAFQAVAPGRLRLTVGIGWNADEFTAADVDITKRGQLTEASLDRLVAGDLSARLGPTEIWSGQHQGKGLARAARHGLGVALPPSQLDDFVRARAEYLRQFRPGRFDRPRVAMFYPLWIEADEDRREWLDAREVELLRSAYAHNWVEDLARGVGDWGRSGLEPAVGTEARRAQRDMLAANRPAKLPLARSSAEMVDTLAQYVEAGVDEIIFLRMDCTGTPAIEERALDMVASDVIPELQRMAK
jgi:alkanesulfonate monooxygenase SsuD/methylene tetrahydromethanopterin reductase-like flavin-dependent oxidoreductase (luciferase family)